uniref:Uncharacterized protein n=1 Tax=Anguilla anguilla TaxID=7936 RepID=A0A0E9QIH7_ANGAN
MYVFSCNISASPKRPYVHLLCNRLIL